MAGKLSKSSHIKVLKPVFALLVAGWLLAQQWLPLGPTRSVFTNFILVCIIVGSILIVFKLVENYYKGILSWCLNNKALFLSLPVVFVILGITIWLGFERTLGVIVPSNSSTEYLSKKFPGIG